MTLRNQIAVYAPWAYAFYEDPASSQRNRAHGGGGAELQTTLIAAHLARSGLRVAHIVYPVRLLAAPDPPLEVVQRAPRPRSTPLVGRAVELARVWGALAQADARLYVIRGGGSSLIIGAAFCVVRGRVLVLSASNDFDFLDRGHRTGVAKFLYRLALRRARRVVVQTGHQLQLARVALGGDSRLTLIPSFAEPAPTSPASGAPDELLWVGRLVEYKLPLCFVELARALPDLRFRMIAPTTGETTTSLKRRLEEVAGRTPNLELLPTLRRERVLELTSRSVALVNTSLYEGMPNTFLEAWSRSVPVLSLHFDPDGRISSERMGICAGGSWERFVEAARLLWEDHELRAELGENGRRYVTRAHSPAVVGDRWAVTLRELLDA